MIEASRVVGATIEVDLEGFNRILAQKKSGYIVTAKSGFLTQKYSYQVSHDGFIFFLQVDESIAIPESFSVIVAEKIYSPITAVR